MKEKYSDMIHRSHYRRYRYLSLCFFILGVVVITGAFVHSFLVKGHLDLYWYQFLIIFGLGALILVSGLLLHLLAMKRIKGLIAYIGSDPITPETIVLSYAMANQEPMRNIEDLHFFMQSQGITDISLPRLKIMVCRAVNNVRMEMIAGPLRAKIFTKDGKGRKYQFGSVFCPDCGVFKNYSKECSFCGHHEMSD